jgi:hypothetical protein
MGKIRQLPGAFSDRILERTELSETPNLENVEIDKNRRMFLCAPHKVYDQNKKCHCKQVFFIKLCFFLYVQDYFILYQIVFSLHLIFLCLS